MTVEQVESPSEMEYRYMVRVSYADAEYIGRTIIDQVVERVSEAITDTFLKERGAEVLAKLDPQAIANLAIAASGAAIRKSLESGFPASVKSAAGLRDER